MSRGALCPGVWLAMCELGLNKARSILSVCLSASFLGQAGSGAGSCPGQCGTLQAALGSRLAGLGAPPFSTRSAGDEPPRLLWIPAPKPRCAAGVRRRSAAGYQQDLEREYAGRGCQGLVHADQAPRGMTGHIPVTRRRRRPRASQELVFLWQRQRWQREKALRGRSALFCCGSWSANAEERTGYVGRHRAQSRVRPPPFNISTPIPKHA